MNLDAMAERFKADTANHELEIVRDDGLYRHLKFRAPGTGFYWFDLVTWPGYLAFVGDMDGCTFTRIPDMFAFFRTFDGGSERINPTYWGEKVTDGRDRLTTYSEARFRTLVAEYVDECAEQFPGLREAVEEQILSEDGYADWDISFEDGAREALRDFKFKPDGGQRFEFADGWDWDLHDWEWSFLWACHAIAWGISQYDAHKAEEKAEAEKAAAESEVAA